MINLIQTMSKLYYNSYFFNKQIKNDWIQWHLTKGSWSSLANLDKASSTTQSAPSPLNTGVTTAIDDHLNFHLGQKMLIRILNMNLYLFALSHFAFLPTIASTQQTPLVLRKNCEHLKLGYLAIWDIETLTLGTLGPWYPETFVL